MSWGVVNSTCCPNGLKGITSDTNGDIYTIANGDIYKTTNTGDLIYSSRVESSTNPLKGITTDINGYIYTTGGSTGGRNIYKLLSSTGEYLAYWAVANGLTSITATPNYLFTNFSNNVYKSTNTGSDGTIWSLGLDTTTGIGLTHDVQNYIYISTRNTIYKYNSDGALISQWQIIDSFGIQVTNIRGITSDKYGYIYVVTEFNVYKTDNTGHFLSQWAAVSSVETSGIRGITSDASGNIYVITEYRVYKYR